MKTTFAFLLIAIAVPFLNSCSGQISAQQLSVYAGEEKREIKSLSPDDIEQLRTGKGWGLAKAAELNGYPGPSHLLEMKTEIGLSESQVEQVQALFEDMKGRAVPLGLKLIDLEKELDKEFAGGTVNREKLEDVLGRIEKVRSDLRLVHLSAHLKTVEILSKEQVAKYNSLRGYGAANPCLNVPPGHDPEMWRKHNGCTGQ
jgi:hypothetical protein